MTNVERMTEAQLRYAFSEGQYTTKVLPARTVTRVLELLEEVRSWRESFEECNEHRHSLIREVFCLKEDLGKTVAVGPADVEEVRLLRDVEKAARKKHGGLITIALAALDLYRAKKPI